MLKGEKVILREKQIGDAAADYAWKRDAEIAHLDATVPIEISFSRYLLEYREELRYYDSRRRRFAIETLDGKHVGNCSYYDIDEYTKGAELGIIIGDKNYWGKGYGSDAVAVLLNHIFTETKLEMVYLHTLVENIQAQKCFQKCGFVSRDKVIRGWHNFIMMDIGKKDWEQRQQRIMIQKRDLHPVQPPLSFSRQGGRGGGEGLLNNLYLAGSGGAGLTSPAARVAGTVAESSSTVHLPCL